MRVTNAAASRKRRTRTIRAAKGFRMRRSKLYRYASDALDHGRQYAYRDRKVRKRTFRYLWQIRINAAVREAGLTYSRFMEGLKAAKCGLDQVHAGISIKPHRWAWKRENVRFVETDSLSTNPSCKTSQRMLCIVG